MSHTRIDPEGQLRGDHPGKAWMAINIGVTAGLAKEADDTLQLIIEAVVSTGDRCFHSRDRTNRGRCCFRDIHGVAQRTRRGVAPLYRDGYYIGSAIVHTQECGTTISSNDN